MDVENRLRETGLPKVSVDTEDALASTTKRGRARRQRQSVVLGTCAVIIVVGLAAAAVVIARDDELTDLATGPAEDAGSHEGVWRPLAPSPLTARAPGIAVWTGSEVVIAGGSDTTPCGSNTDCLVELSPLADGAAYDPATDSWRPIPDAPISFLRGPVTWTGTEVLVLAQQQNPGAANTMLAYDPASDRWTTRADPPVGGLRSMTWTGDAWVGITSYGTSDETAWRYRPATDSWDALPADPIGQLSDRAIVWTGIELILVGSRYDQPGASPNGQWEAATLGTDGTWRELPASGIENNGGTWSAIDGLVVNPGTGPINDFETGGILDPSTGEWSPVPDDQAMTTPPNGTTGGQTGFEGVAGGWIVDNSRLLDPIAGEWRAVEARPDQVAPGVAAWTGTEIISWGGTIDLQASAPELVAAGYAYQPPSAPTATDAESPGTTAQPEPERGDAATWDVDPSTPPSSDSSTFTALVTRIDCNSGVTGRVLRPGIVVEADRIVITFTVEADADGGDCPSNDWVPYSVDVGQPIGTRALVDGECAPDGETGTNCERWTPERAEDADEVYVVTGQLMMVGGIVGTESDPAPGTVTAEDEAGMVATAEADDNGQFELSVRAGNYRLTGRSPFFQNGEVDCEAEGEIVVATDDVVGVTVLCQRR